jgi:DNA-binding SARP family transcriptional activator/tetratricopeptide (TPR) repeat protein
MGSAEDGVHVRLFGDACLRAGGDPINLTPHQLALVALVYGSGSAGVSRPVAATCLWGRDSADKGRQRLRQLLFEVRARVAQPIVDTHADVLRPVTSVESDLRAFSAAIEAGRLQSAASILERGFLPSVDGPTDEYEDWRDGRASSLERSLRAVALRHWATAQSNGDWRVACDAAEALLLLDPDSPEAVERAIRARGRAGDLEGAERALAEHLARLPSGSVPDRVVAQAIETARSIRRIQGLTHPDATVVPFVGRQAALSRTYRTLDALRDGHFEMLLISGESGIGKTRVLGEVCREAAARGFRCLRADAVELERGIPLNCILDSLRDVDLESHLEALGRPWSSVIASLLPPGALRHPPEEPPPIQPSSLSRRLLDSFSLLFDRLAREQPTVLFIDDLQWADATTVAALQFMQRRWTEGVFGVFATVRPDLVRVTDPVAHYLTTADGPRADVIELPVLTTEEAHSLIGVVADKELGAPVVQRLCAIAGHHPLYLAELTREFLAGRVQLPERTGDPLRIPASLARMLDARLEAMSERARKVAGVLAVAGRPLRIDALADLADLTIQQSVDAVDALLHARFVELDRSEVRMAHELFRSAVYRQLSEPRRALHHRAIATHLLADGRDEFAGEVAVHYSRAGDDELAATFGWAAAKRASEAGALAEAIQFYEVVAECESDPLRKAQASAELADVLYLARDITRANPQLCLAAERLRSLGRLEDARRLEIKRVEGLAEVGDLAVPVLIDLITDIKQEAESCCDWETVALALDAELHLLHRGGDVDGIRVVLQQMRRVASLGSTHARLVCMAGLALGVFFGDPIEALGAARNALQIAAEARAYRLRALVRYMIVLHARGELSNPGASPIVAEARSLAEASGDVMERFAIESNVAVALLDEGEVESAEAMMARTAQIAETAEMHMHRFIRANNHAELALAVGDFDAAKQAFAEAATYLGPTSPSYMRDIVNAGLGYCALESGDVGEARRREKDLSDLPPSWYYDPTTLLAFRARLLERRGKWQEAVAIIRRAAADLEGRIVLAWYKLRLLEVRMLIKYGHPDARPLAEEGERRAQEAGLIRRAGEFATLVGDGGSRAEVRSR